MSRGGYGYGYARRFLGGILNASSRFPRDGMQAYYKIKESSFPNGDGSQLNDSSGNTNNLTQTTSANQPTYVQNENKVAFDTNDYMEGLPVQSGDFSYVFKGVLVQDTGQHHALATDGLSIGVDGIWINLGGTAISINDGTVKQLSISAPLWGSLSDIVLTYTQSDSTYRLYINGSAEGTTTGVGIAPIALSSPTGALDGTIADAVAVYNRALTQREVENISRRNLNPVARYNVLPTSFPNSDGSEWLDSSSKQLGSELVTNGDFSDGDNDWILASGVSVSGGNLEFNNVNGGWSYSDTSNTTTGNRYFLKVEVSSYTQGSVIFYDSVSGSTITTISSSGSFLVPFTATNDANTIAFVGTSSATLLIKTISVKQVINGYNDLTQSTSANQPTVSATEVTFDANDYMTGLPVQSGDFTYVFKGVECPNNKTTYLLGSSTDSSALVFFSDRHLYLRKTDGSVDLQITSTPLPTSKFDLVVTSTSTEAKTYVDGSLDFTADNTGRSYTITDLGTISDSLDGTISDYIEVYDFALRDYEVASISGVEL